MTPTILVVEDDKDLQGFLKDLLTSQGFVVHMTSKGSEAISMVDTSEPDLMVLDLTLPDMSGEGVCTEVRKNHASMPIVMLTAKSAVAERVQGLALGADDYITKPFVPEEFVARVKARLRDKGDGARKLVLGDLELDPQKVEVRRNGKIIHLTAHEFKLLEYLMSHVGVVLSREMILNRVWAYNFDVESRVVDVYMGYLRKKIDSGASTKLIHSVRGFGYTLKLPDKKK